MKTGIKTIFTAALAALVSTAFAPWARAGNPTTNAPAAGGDAKAATASTGIVSAPANSNASAAATMAALFGDPVIAKGKGFEIKRSELDEVLFGLKSAAAAHGQLVPPEQLTLIEGQMLNRLIQIQLLLQKATDADKTNGTQKANLQIAALLERAGSQEALDRQLKAIGMTPGELRPKVTREAIAQAALVRGLNVTVTDAEAKQFYDGHPAEFEQPEMAHVRHILLMTMDPATREPLPTDQQQAKRKLIDEILKRARAGENFEALVKQYSEDSGSKDRGGEYTFPRASADPVHAMVPEFEAAAFSLTNNQISDVVVTAYGCHIIKLLDKTPAKKVDYATVTGKIKDFLTQQKVEQLAPAYLDKLKKDAGVEILDADLKAAAGTEAPASTNAPAAPPGK
jgi:parvulin-like peptidyl-prolyl isomerase